MSRIGLICAVLSSVWGILPAAPQAAIPPAATTQSADPAGFSQLLRDLRGVHGPRRESRIQLFLEKRPEAELDALKARLLLATEWLRRFALRRAAAEFDAVLAAAAPEHRSLRARALYGRAQCAELSRSDSREFLAQVIRDFPDLRYSRYAESALARLRRARPLRLGDPAPRIARFRDLTGRDHSLESRIGRAVLVVFVAPDDKKALARTSRLLQIWREARLEPTDAIVFAVHAAVPRLRVVAKEEGWPGPVVPCTGVFFESPLLEFGVRALPDAFLIGPDGSLLLRSPSPKALRKVLGLLR